MCCFFSPKAPPPPPSPYQKWGAELEAERQRTIDRCAKAFTFPIVNGPAPKQDAKPMSSEKFVPPRKPEELTKVYRTSDGKLHATAEEADRYETVPALARLFGSLLLGCGGITGSVVRGLAAITYDAGFRYVPEADKNRPQPGKED